jgi:ribosomal protein S18 acetylase RimI-like enzyme
MDIRVLPVEFSNPTHAAALVELLDLYAQDEMGDRQPLPDEVKRNLVPRLAATWTCRAWVAWEGERPVGVLIAFLGFSTFRAQPLLNLHDIAVRPGARGGGIGKQLIAAAEATARELGCCKMTLEVRIDNDPAKRCYAACGFEPGEPHQEFWRKAL